MNDLTTFLTSDWMPLAVLAKLGWLLQLGLIVHAFRTGRPYWWFWILFSAPFIGGLIYLLVEIAPGWRGPRGDLLGALKPRAWRLRELRAALEDSDVVKNRLALADELLAAGRAQEAHDVAAESLQGAFRDDPHTLAAVARCKIEIGAHTAALALLDKVKTQADRRLAVQVALLRGRALLGAGKPRDAEPHFRALDGSFIGDEPQCHLADVLHATGRRAEAVELWQAILKRYRRASPAWRRSERPWFRRAKQRLAENKA